MSHTPHQWHWPIKRRAEFLPVVTPLTRRRVRLDRVAMIILFLLLAFLVIARRDRAKTVWAVVVDGTPRAYLQNEADANAAVALLLRKAPEKFRQNARFHQTLELRRLPAANTQTTKPQEAAALLGKQLDIVIPACMLWVDGEAAFALPDREEAETLLQDLVDHYMPEGAQLVGTASFKEKVELREVNLLPRVAESMFATRQEALEKLTAPSIAGEKYEIRPGDNATGIAARFGITLAELKAANLGKDLNLIRAGDTLSIVGGPPLITVVFRVKEDIRQQVPFWTERLYDPSLKPGEHRILQEGLPGQQVFHCTVTYENRKEVSRVARAGKILQGPTPERIVTGRPGNS